MVDDCQQWQSNYPSASSTIFKYFSMKRPIMEATALQCSYNIDTAKHNIKTEDTIEAKTEANSMATAPSMASMAAAASMFNRLHDTAANFTSR